MPINYKDYPKNWKDIRKLVLQRAGNKCELCGAKNKEKHPVTGSKVVLTIHHINSDKSDNRACNLIALCQRCHLRLDLCKHIDNRKNKKEVIC